MEIKVFNEENKFPITQPYLWVDRLENSKLWSKEKVICGVSMCVLAAEHRKSSNKQLMPRIKKSITKGEWEELQCSVMQMLWV